MQNLEVLESNLGIAQARIRSLGNNADKTANYTIPSSGTYNSGDVFTNNGAGGAVTFTLPAPKQGLYYRFFKVANQTMTVTATGGAKISNGSANGSLANSTAGDVLKGVLTLFCADGANWWILESTGTWA